MKFILTSLCLLLANTSWGNTTEIRNFLFEGTEESRELNLTTEATRIEYRRVVVRSTCYRQVVRRVCQPSGRNGEVQCRNVRRTVPYACNRVENRPFQVFDRYVDTTVKFEFNNANLEDGVQENFIVKVTGNKPTLSVNSSRNYIITLEKKDIRSSMRGRTEMLDVTYKVNFLPAEGAASVLQNGIQNVKLRSGVLTFKLGAGFNFEDFSQQIRIFKNRRLGRDTLLLNKYLSRSETNVQSTSNASIVTINLKSLGVNLPSKMRVILDTQLKGVDPNTVLNANEVKTSASANWIFR